jgi:starch phosphorylase
MKQPDYDTLRPDLPEEISDLYRLALDLRWSWSHAADELWRYIDADLWYQTQNPWLILQTVSRSRLRKLAADEQFIALLQAMREEQLLAQKSTGWIAAAADTPVPQVAYFSMEFGISEALPIYSGGLGVLAGDHLKSSGESGLALTGIGLLYQQGYFRQGLNADGEQLEFYPYNDPTQLPVRPARSAHGEWLHVAAPLPGRNIMLRLWQAQIGRIALYLLDSNTPLNSPADRGITSELYGGGAEMRLQQEIVLGIGGYRALRALEISPDVCHLNEGHAAFVVLERAREFMEQRQCSFEIALTATRAGNLFTTHTPVDAGFDRFSPTLFCQYLQPYARQLRINCETLLEMGQTRTDGQQTLFNMAVLATRGSAAVNAVSRLHRRVSQQLFSALYPHWPLAEVPIGYITNGVHVPTWDSENADRIWTRYCGKKRWHQPRNDLAQIIRKIDDDTLWTMRSQNRQALISWLRKRLLCQHSLGYLPDEQPPLDQVLDPNALTLGFARRFASYKRPNLLLQDRNRLARLLTTSDRPVQLVIAGKAHPQDTAGKQMIGQWIAFIRDYNLQSRVIFVIDHDLTIAKHLVQGVDLWINTPRRPWEASGTSGMKVLVNGGLNLSELDGWWAEAYTPEVGYKLGDGREHDPGYDAIEAQALYELLEQRVVPDFYNRNQHGIPTAWVARIRESMAQLTPLFSTNRMVQDYYQKYYAPLAKNYRQRAASNARLAREISGWQRKIETHWDAIHLGNFEAITANGRHEFSIQVYLDDLDANDVKVQLFADPLDDENPICLDMRQAESLTGAINGYRYYIGIDADRRISDYTIRVVPHHPQANLPLENGHILWQR